MSATPQAQKLFGHAEDNNYLKCSSGIKSWLFTLDHKRIGIMYLIGVTVALFLAGIFALILRSELFTGDENFLTEAQYNQMFTLHGAIMVFAFIWLRSLNLDSVEDNSVLARRNFCAG